MKKLLTFFYTFSVTAIPITTVVSCYSNIDNRTDLNEVIKNVAIGNQLESLSDSIIIDAVIAKNDIKDENFKNEVYVISKTSTSAIIIANQDSNIFKAWVKVRFTLTKSSVNIGTDIDKSKAINDTKNTISGYSNYFVVGDSLSDVDGITNLMPKKFESVFNLLNADVNINITGNYGFEENGVWHSAFSNGPTAGYLLSQKLGFGELKSSNKFMKPYDKTSEGYGNNYSIGGATAAKISEGQTGAVGLLFSSLDDVTVDQQARTLIEQHKVGSNDVALVEIGGNDLFAIAANYPDQIVVDKLIDDGIERIRQALFTLLNNGIKKVIFMTPPDMQYVPIFNKYFDEYSNVEENIIINENDSDNVKKAKSLVLNGREYEKRILEVSEKIQAIYKEQFKIFDLYKELPSFMDKFKSTAVDSNKVNLEDQYSDLIGNTEIKAEINGETLLQLSTSVLGLSENFDLAEVLKSDLTSKLLENLNFKDLMEKIQKYLGSTSRNKIDINISLGTDKKAETNSIDDYFFTDFVHPTKRVHEIVSEYIYETYLK